MDRESVMHCEKHNLSWVKIEAHRFKIYCPKCESESVEVPTNLIGRLNLMTRDPNFGISREEEPKEHSQIYTAFSVLGDKLAELSELIAELQRKLGPVLSPPEVAVVAEDRSLPNPNETPAPMTSDLWGKIRKTTAANDSIREIFSRLEL